MREQLNFNINSAAFDSDEATDSNMVLLDNRTAYALNVINDLLTRGNVNGARRALSELRLNGRIFNSQKFYDVAAVLAARPE